MMTTEKDFTIINGEEIVTGLNDVEASEHIGGFFWDKHGVANAHLCFDVQEDATTVTVTCL